MQYAWDNGISCVLTDKMNEHTPSSAQPKNKIILINLNWYNQSEIIFQMAHEIGHVINNDEGVLYYSSFSNKSSYERNANLKALDILIPIYLDIIGDYNSDSVFPFMEAFCIPNRLENDVLNAFRNSISKQAN
ncbi:ImmA/IrrE family metallo-endopeptidase [Levilactobacillus brevis]|nr:ImmA/IrrE family metallo-endopeptidase [Levilactobacillus spicheri]QOX68262.1 ImmA/IrrE family metallo-endopeptidase [Levilactobacillus brevis]GEO66222.1 hypothetical protein LSP04_06410 [Levilactobacillus spicheri]